MLSRKSEIDRLAAEIEELKHSYQANKDELEKKKARAGELLSACSDAEGKITELDKSLIAVNGQIELIEKSLEGAKDSDEKKERELATIENDFAKLEKTVEGLTDSAKMVEALRAFKPPLPR